MDDTFDCWGEGMRSAEDEALGSLINHPRYHPAPGEAREPAPVRPRTPLIRFWPPVSRGGCRRTRERMRPGRRTTGTGDTRRPQPSRGCASRRGRSGGSGKGGPSAGGDWGNRQQEGVQGVSVSPAHQGDAEPRGGPDGAQCVAVGPKFSKIPAGSGIGVARGADASDEGGAKGAPGLWGGAGRGGGDGGQGGAHGRKGEE